MKLRDLHELASVLGRSPETINRPRPGTGGKFAISATQKVVTIFAGETRDVLQPS